MMRHDSRRPRLVRVARLAPRFSLRGAGLGAAVAVGCATGLDVTDAELAEICSDPSIRCEGAVGSAGVAGNLPTAGASTSGTGGTLGGTAGASGAGGAGGVVSNGGSTGNVGGVQVFGGGTGATLGGTGGAAGAGPQPLAMGECLESDDVVILYENRKNDGPTSNEASMDLGVQNNGAAFDLTDLTIRYWFTADGLTGFTGEIDYASQGGGQQLNRDTLTVNFNQESGSDYAEIGFTVGGSVGPEGVDTVQLRLHTSDYQQLNHANDFSFIEEGDGQANRNITPYLNGVQVGGCIPLP